MRNDLQALASRCLDEAVRETRIPLATEETPGVPVLHSIPDPMKRASEIFGRHFREIRDADLPQVGSFHG